MKLLEIAHLSKRFKQVEAVKDISFEVKQGEILGLLGPNGAGKSTTISMIATLLKQDKGTITFCGEDILRKPKAIQKCLGYVPQEIALYPMLSGKENMIFWGRAYGLKGSELHLAIERVSEIIGIKDRLKDTVKTYSGGMQRRLNIGVALLHSPDIIIMDEPTVGIDPQSRKHILDTVVKLNQAGKTVIYTSHYMEEVQFLCHRICIMDRGIIIAEGSKDELIAQAMKEKQICLRLATISTALIESLMKLRAIKKVKQENHSLMIDYEDNGHIFQEIIDTVAQTGEEILDFDVMKPDLETVFLKLTGRALRD